MIFTGAEIIREAAVDWEEYTENGEISFPDWFPQMADLKPRQKYRTDGMLSYFEEVDCDAD